MTWLAQQTPERRAKLLAWLRQNLTRRLALGSSLMAALLTVSWGMTQPDGRLHVAFLDVGQGDAIFIQTPAGRQILVDGGHYPSLLNDRLGRQMPFWDKEIDIVVATHPDAVPCPPSFSKPATMALIPPAVSLSWKQCGHRSS